MKPTPKNDPLRQILKENAMKSMLEKRKKQKVMRREQQPASPPDVGGLGKLTATVSEIASALNHFLPARRPTVADVVIEPLQLIKGFEFSTEAQEAVDLKERQDAANSLLNRQISAPNVRAGTPLRPDELPTIAQLSTLTAQLVQSGSPVTPETATSASLMAIEIWKASRNTLLSESHEQALKYDRAEFDHEHNVKTFNYRVICEEFLQEFKVQDVEDKGVTFTLNDAAERLLPSKPAAARLQLLRALAKGTTDAAWIATRQEWATNPEKKETDGFSWDQWKLLIKNVALNHYAAAAAQKAIQVKTARLASLENLKTGPMKKEARESEQSKENARKRRVEKRLEKR